MRQSNSRLPLLLLIAGLLASPSAGTAPVYPIFSGRWDPAGEEKVRKVLALIPDRFFTNRPAPVFTQESSSRISVHKDRIRFSSESSEREIACAVFLFLDKRTGWSRHPRWRAVQNWPSFPGRLRPSPNRNKDSFLHPEGRSDPSKEFSACAAEFLLGKTDRTNGGIKRFFASFPGLTNGHWKGNLSEEQKAGSIELLLASPSPRSFATLFGHIFVRVVPAGDGTVPPVLGTEIHGFGASTFGPMEADPFYVPKAVFGIYDARLSSDPMDGFYRKYCVEDQRDIERWKISLNPEEELRLLERLADVRRGHRYGYKYFTYNCGTMLADLFRGFGPHPEIRFPRPLFSTMPTAVLEGFLTEDRLEPLDEPFYSMETLAARADKKSGLLLSSSSLIPTRLNRKRRSADAAMRTKAYTEINERFSAAGKERELLLFLDQSLVIENHAVVIRSLEENKKTAIRTKKNLRREARLLDRKLRRSQPAWSGPIKTLNHPRWSVRQHAYTEIERLLSGHQSDDADAADLRMLSLCRTWIRYDWDRPEGKTERERIVFPDSSKILREQSYFSLPPELFDPPDELKIPPVVFLLSGWKADLLSLNPGLKTNLSQERKANREDLRRREEERRRNAHRRTGAVYSEYGAVMTRRNTEWTPSFLLTTAALFEPLGAPRLVGFPSRSSVSVLRFDHTLDERFRYIRTDATLFEFLSCPRNLRQTTGNKQGWGGRLSWKASYRYEENTAASRIEGGLIRTLLNDSVFTRFWNFSASAVFRGQNENRNLSGSFSIPFRSEALLTFYTPGRPHALFCEILYDIPLLSARESLARPTASFLLEGRFSLPGEISKPLPAYVGFIAGVSHTLPDKSTRLYLKTVFN